MTFRHLNLPSPLPFERREENKQISIFHFPYEVIQGTRKRPADNNTQEIELSIMTGADVMLLVGMPGHAATEAGINAGEDARLISFLRTICNSLLLYLYSPQVPFKDARRYVQVDNGERKFCCTFEDGPAFLHRGKYQGP